jgi:hypothetical protein
VAFSADSVPCAGADAIETVTGWPFGLAHSNDTVTGAPPAEVADDAPHTGAAWRVNTARPPPGPVASLAT